MSEPFISSDPNAWLRPYWQALHQQQSFFANLAPELQAKALADALEEDHPNHAAEVREWNAATRRAMIAVLDQALKERHADRQTELWRMTKGSREVTCARPCGARRRPGPTRTPGSAPGYRRWVCRRRCSSSSGATTASGCPTLSGRAYNVKGAQKVDLTWDWLHRGHAGCEPQRQGDLHDAERRSANRSDRREGRRIVCLHSLRDWDDLLCGSYRQIVECRVKGSS